MDKVSDQLPKDEIISDDVINDKPKEDSVKYETYLRTLKQEKAAKERAASLEKELNEFRAKEESSKVDKLKEQQRFEELSKDLESQLKAEREEKESYQKGLLDTHKLQAVLEKLPGKPKKKEYLNFIDLDQIEIDPDSGIVESSVEIVANNFLTNYGELIDRPGKGLPNDAPSSTGKLTKEQWVKLPLADKKKRLHEVIDS